MLTESRSETSKQGGYSADSGCLSIRGAVAGLSGPSVGALQRPRHLSNLVEFQSWRGIDRLFPQPVARVLIDAQQHGRVSMAHDLRHRLHIRAMLKSFRGHGMAQAIGRYAPRDARRFSGLMPGMAYAAHRASLPVDDPRTALFLVFLLPCPPVSGAVMVWPARLYVIVHDHVLHGLHGLGGIHSGQQFVTAGGVPCLDIRQPLRILYGKQGRADAHVLRSRSSGGHGQ